MCYRVFTFRGWSCASSPRDAMKEAQSLLQDIFAHGMSSDYWWARIECDSDYTWRLVWVDKGGVFHSSPWLKHNP